MKTLRNSINENIINEGKVSITYIEQPNNAKYDLTPGGICALM